MKRYILSLIIISLLATLFGCANSKRVQTSAWRKQDIQEFKSIFIDFAKKQNITLPSVVIDAFRDITPPDVFKETGCQIFKNGKTCESYLLYDRNLYTLGIGIGGLGTVDFATCDFDGKGEKGLLYTYSWGSGLHRSCVGYFDLSRNSESEVKISSVQPLSFIQDELVLKKVSDSKFKVYTAVVTIDGGDFTKMSVKQEKLFGEIKAVENKPVLFIK